VSSYAARMEALRGWEEYAYQRAHGGRWARNPVLHRVRWIWHRRSMYDPAGLVQP
jgi:hypothetical protein